MGVGAIVAVGLFVLAQVLFSVNAQHTWFCSTESNTKHWICVRNCWQNENSRKQHQQTIYQIVNALWIVYAHIKLIETITAIERDRERAKETIFVWILILCDCEHNYIVFIDCLSSFFALAKHCVRRRCIEVNGPWTVHFRYRFHFQSTRMDSLFAWQSSWWLSKCVILCWLSERGKEMGASRSNALNFHSKTHTYTWTKAHVLAARQHH